MLKELLEMKEMCTTSLDKKVNYTHSIVSSECLIKLAKTWFRLDGKVVEYDEYDLPSANSVDGQDFYNKLYEITPKFTADGSNYSCFFSSFMVVQATMGEVAYQVAFVSSVKW